MADGGQPARPKKNEKHFNHPPHRRLKGWITAPDASDAILLERKDDMRRRRGLGSPDDGDALAAHIAFRSQARLGRGTRLEEGLQRRRVGSCDPQRGRGPV